MEKREFKIEYVTPERAKELLGRNYSGQRKLTAKRREYARLMANGLWDETACPPLKFTADGTLLDGQHRLQAVIDSGVPIMFVLDIGGDESQFSRIDIGKPRSAAGFVNSPQASEVASLARCVVCWNNGQTLGESLEGRLVARDAVSTVETVDYANANADELHDYTLAGRRVSKAVGGAATAYAFSVYVYSKLNGEGAPREFVDLLVALDGEDVTVKATWKALLRVNRAGVRASRQAVAGVFVKGLDYWANGKELRIMKNAQAFLVQNAERFRKPASLL